MVQKAATIQDILAPEWPGDSLREEDRQARSKSDWAAIRADEQAGRAPWANDDDMGTPEWALWATGWSAALDEDLAVDAAADLAAIDRWEDYYAAIEEEEAGGVY